MPKLKAIFSRRWGIGSFLIRLGSWWSPWSHVGVLIDDNIVIEATAGKGVVETKIETFKRRASAYEIVEYDCPNPEAAIAFLKAQVGRGYDWGGVFAFVFREPWESKTKWFCNELLEAALAIGGRHRFQNHQGRITPNQSYITR